MDDALAAARSLLKGPRLALVTSLRRADAPADQVEMVAVTPRRGMAHRHAADRLRDRAQRNRRRGRGAVLGALDRKRRCRRQRWARPPRRSTPCSRPPGPWANGNSNWSRHRTEWSRRPAASPPKSCSAAMHVPGFVFNPIALAIEGAAIGFLIAVPVGPAAVLCIRRSITVGAVAGYMTGHRRGAGRRRVRRRRRPSACRSSSSSSSNAKPGCCGIGGIGLVIMGWTTMRHRPRTVGDPVADDREHQVATHFHYASSSFFITVFNPLDRDGLRRGLRRPQSGGRRRQPGRRRRCWWRRCSAARSPGGRSSARPPVSLRHRFTGPACCG